MTVYQSTELRNYCENNKSSGDKAIKVAENYISGAFNRIDGISVNFRDDTRTIDCRYQRIFDNGNEDGDRLEDFYDYDPGCCIHCSDPDYMYFSSLLDYWNEAVDHCNSLTIAEDINILLTAKGNGAGGITNDSDAAVVATGKAIADLPTSYKPRISFDSSYPARGVHVLLHEVGHCLAVDDDEDNDGISEHDQATLYLIGNDGYPDGYYGTPMKINSKGVKSYCGESNDEGLSFNCSEVEGREMRWGPAVTEEMESA